MADNVTLAQGTFAADDVGGVLYPRNKLSIGGDGIAADVSTSNPLPVSVQNLPATQPVSAAALPLPAGAATSARQDTLATATALIGTRSYGAPLARLAVASVAAQSAAIAAGGEVLLHASTRCFIAAGANPTATTDGIPLEAGEKFHMRIAANDKISALRDTTDGFLNIVPVA